MDQRTLATLRLIAFTFGCAVMGALFAVGWVRGASGGVGVAGFIGGASIGWSLMANWFYRDVPPAPPGRAFEVIPEAQENR
jgi:hypothetical protein